MITKLKILTKDDSFLGMSGDRIFVKRKGGDVYIYTVEGLGTSQPHLSSDIICVTRGNGRVELSNEDPWLPARNSDDDEFGVSVKPKKLK